MATVRETEDTLRRHGVRWRGHMRRRLVQSGVIPAGVGGRNGSGSPRIDASTALHLSLALATRGQADPDLPLRIAVGIDGDGIEAHRDIDAPLSFGNILLLLCTMAVSGEAAVRAVYVAAHSAEIVADVRGASVYLSFGDRDGTVTDCIGIAGDALVAVAQLFTCWRS